jgi:hypothetical protein
MSIERLGAQIAYLALKDGTPVFDREQNRVGVVERVLATGNIFEGLVVHTYPLPGRHLYADADQIADIREHGVLLCVPGDELHDPAKEVRPRRGDRPADGLQGRLRHAWDWIRGAP